MMKKRFISFALAIVMILSISTPVSLTSYESEDETLFAEEHLLDLFNSYTTTPAAISVMNASEYFLRIYGRTDPWNGIDIDFANIPGVNLSTHTYTLTITGFVPGGSGNMIELEEPLNGTPAWENRFHFNRSVNGENFTITLNNVNEAFFAGLQNHNRMDGGTSRRIRIRCIGPWPDIATSEFAIENVTITNGGNVIWSLAQNVLHAMGVGEITPIWDLNNIDGIWVAATSVVGFSVVKAENRNGSDTPPAPPVFSANAGFFAESFNLILTSEPDTVIRYTTDGSIPTQSSPVYTNPILIHSPEPTQANSPMSFRGVGRYVSGWSGGLPVVTNHDYVPRFYYNGMVVRARAFNGNAGSETVTRSFFVDRDGRGRFNTQVMSISVEPEHFAGETQGLYRNWFRQGWPMQPVVNQTRQIVHMEMFGADGKLMHQQNAEAWVYGNWSRGNPKRSLRFNFNAGDGDIRNLPQFIPDTRRNYYAPTELVRNFRHLNARISDPGDSEIRECIVHFLSEPLRPTIQNSTYGAVFVNGEFWAMYNLRAHRHEHLIGQMYGVSRSNVEISDNTMPFHTSINALAPFTVQENYEALNNIIDMDNFIDYIIIGYHFDNWDWVNNNFEFWRTTEYIPDVYGGDMRWRFVIHDFDNGINHPSNNMMTFLTSRSGMDPPMQLDPWGNAQLRPAWAANTFINLFQNEEFRNTFAARYSTYTGTAFHPSRVNAILDRMVDERMDTIGADMYRWSFHGAQTPTDSNAMNNWLTATWWGYRSSIYGVQQVLTRRANYSIGHIRGYYNRTDRPNLSLGLDTSGFTNIKWTTDSDMGFFDIAGAQIRADLFDRGNLDDYAFCVSDFNAQYIRGLPVEVTARAYSDYVFSHFEITIGSVTESVYENPTSITPPRNSNTPIIVNAVFEEEIIIPGEYTVLMKLTRTEPNATADAGNQFNATGGLFRSSSHLTAWSGNVRRPIGIDGTNRAPMVFNNFSDGWRSVNQEAQSGNPDFGVTVDTASAFEIIFETTGHENIRFSARQRSTGSGPDFFALAYRIGSEGGFTSIPGTKTENRQSPSTHQNNNYTDFDRPATQSFDKFLLPAEVENQEEVYLRVYMRESKIPASGRSNGNTSINDIEIIGDEMEGVFVRPTFSIATVNGRAGRNVSVNVNISKNPGFAAMMFKLDVPQGITLTRVKTHEDLEDFFHAPEDENVMAASQVVMGWTGMTHETGNFTQDGTILTLTFYVDENAAPDFYPLTAIFSNAHGVEEPANYAGQSLNISIKNGGIEVIHSDCIICAGACTLGDIDGDGRITSADATALARHLINPNFEICLYAADFFGDGILTPYHVTLLARLLVGLDVALGNNNG